MAYCDFVVKYDPKKDTLRDISRRIIYSVFIGRVRNNKPCVIFLGGESGDGKSFTGLTLQSEMMLAQGVDPKKYVSAMNIYTPLQYPEKINALLFDKELKKVNVLCVHEAREVVKAKLWASFLTQSIADVNAMSRSIKRLVIIIISQFIRDITTDMRYTLNYYCKVIRPKGRKARLYINVLWKDDSDLEKPKLRKRKLSGYLVYPNGVYKRYVPQYIELNKPDPEIVAQFEKDDYDSKAGIIKKKLSKLIKEMQADIGEQSNKVASMVEWYSTRSENIDLIGKRYKGKLRVSKDFKDLHDMTVVEVKEFETKINEALIKKGIQ